MSMSIRLTVRAGGIVRVWTTNEWSVLVALAAIPAGPESMAEFYTALRRYEGDHSWESLGESAVIEDAFSTAEAACLIDLDSRSVLAGGGFELPDRCDALQAEEDDHAEGFPIVWLYTPDDWLYETVSADWLSRLDSRAEARESYRSIDTRAVLYGSPMLSFIADRIVAIRAEASEEEASDPIRAIHAEWLMTPRDELQGRTPREVLLEGRNYICMDIERRSQQWSQQGFAPPPLPVGSAAYRLGGYGTIEVVMYFDLMRLLLENLWDWTEGADLPLEVLLEQLIEEREAFLDQPPHDGGSRLTVRELIESERRRMPLTADGSHLDCDCPVCQMEADGLLGSGPMFMSYDGHQLELEDEFAFSMTETREKWEKEQDDFKRFNEEFDRKQAEREAAGDGPESAWKSSFVDWDNVVADTNGPISGKIAIGFLLAELISGLQRVDAPQATLDALSETYANYRRAEDRIVEESAAENFRNSLERIAETYPDLTPQSADLQSRLDELLRS